MIPIADVRTMTNHGKKKLGSHAIPHGKTILNKLNDFKVTHKSI
jgi:hypothetical protein